MTGSPGPKQDEEDPGFSMVRFQRLWEEGTSRLISTAVVFPVYKIVFRLQINNTSVCTAVRQLYKEGRAKLYRGVAPPLLMNILRGTVVLNVQDTLLRQLSLSSQDVLPTSALPALAGFGAGVVEAVLFTPLERIQNVQQNSQNDRRLPTLRSVLRDLYAQRLSLGFYRGFLPMTARDALGSSLFFGLKGPVCEVVAGKGLSPMVSSFLSATLTSMGISLALYPLSVLVANMQAQVEGEQKGAMACWRMLWKSRQQSLFLLYRGGSLVILRSCITWGIMTAFYDKQQKQSG